ncbi:acidic fibroblast growth factor intracellular-binding protein-like isoform X2 [Anneissia japonica]|uniref:acidic fibroblast growth factor intracellular-binding protein-like isoform X2 n=1 Tax=Anneissia japonica TaxID=1529436 RepID=UPI0014255A58|nr:acidic fibroblast growth factor intracellular-binding protein-like isoform X2 [Anneissia japonica]
MGDSELLVFVGNMTFVDTDVFQLWLEGKAVIEASNVRYKSGKFAKVRMQHIVSDIEDNYRNFMAIEKYLRNPPSLSNQVMFQIPQRTQEYLIQEYYSLNSSVAREILGKKLSSRHRKDLDEVSEKTDVTLKSCRRQYDNFKRVFKTVEDMQGSMVKNITENFLLSKELAKKYAAIVFFANNRFETGKKRLAFVTFDDFVYCADKMINNWTVGSANSSAKEDLDADFDRDFLRDLRELKILGEKDCSEQHRSFVRNTLKGKVSETVISQVHAEFRNLTKAIINIGSNMIHSKDLRDFFLDVVEKIIEPCKQDGWSAKDMAAFLNAYNNNCKHLECFGRQPKLQMVQERYMDTLTSCILKMFHN